MKSVDLIVGADEIAKELGLKRRQIYAMREAKHPLIRHEPGLGIVASRTAVLNYFGIAVIVDNEGTA